MAKPKLGDIVAIEIYDHADMEGQEVLQNESGVLVFECFGRLVRETKLDYRIMTWGNPDNHLLDHNNEFYSILKADVRKLRVLK